MAKIITPTNSYGIQKALDEVSSAGGGNIMLLPGIYNIDAKVELRSDVGISGEASFPYWGEGVTLLRSGLKDTMFEAQSGVKGWGINNVRLVSAINEGSAVDYPILEALDTPAIGSYNAHLKECTFIFGRPAIHAINAWEWWLTNCGFLACGNSASAIEQARSAICLLNSRTAGSGGFCNGWHFTGCTGDVTLGYWIDSMVNGIGVPGTIANTNFMLTDNTLEGYNGTVSTPFRGHSIIHGTINNWSIKGNWFSFNPQNDLSEPLLHLIGNNGLGGYNTITAGNRIREFLSTARAIESTNYFDTITDNNFSGNSDKPPVLLSAGSYRNRITGNGMYNYKGDIDMVEDKGSHNSYYLNEGAEAAYAVTNGKLPMKIQGTQFYVPLSK